MSISLLLVWPGPRPGTPKRSKTRAAQARSGFAVGLISSGLPDRVVLDFRIVLCLGRGIPLPTRQVLSCESFRLLPGNSQVPGLGWSPGRATSPIMTHPSTFHHLGLGPGFGVLVSGGASGAPPRSGQVRSAVGGELALHLLDLVLQLVRVELEQLLDLRALAAGLRAVLGAVLGVGGAGSRLERVLGVDPALLAADLALDLTQPTLCRLAVDLLALARGTERIGQDLRVLGALQLDQARVLLLALRLRAVHRLGLVLQIQELLGQLSATLDPDLGDGARDNGGVL